MTQKKRHASARANTHAHTQCYPCAISKGSAHPRLLTAIEFPIWIREQAVIIFRVIDIQLGSMAAAAAVTAARARGSMRRLHSRSCLLFPRHPSVSILSVLSPRVSTFLPLLLSSKRGDPSFLLLSNLFWFPSPLTLTLFLSLSTCCRFIKFRER